MKELDLLLDSWLRARFEQASAPEREAFIGLLELPDPDLVRYLLGGERPSTPELTSAVDAVLAHARIMSHRA